MVEDHHAGKGVWSHADDGELLSVEANGLADDVGVAGKFVFPKVGAEHDHRIAAGNLIFVVAEAAAQSGLDTEDAEVVAGDHHSPAHAWRGAGVRGESDGL